MMAQKPVLPQNIFSSVSNNGKPPASNRPAIHHAQQNLLHNASEQVWLSIASLAEMVGDTLKTHSAYEAALKHNPFCHIALKKLVSVYKSSNQFAMMTECLQRLLTIDGTDGRYWADLGRCYIELNEPQKSFSAFQQALYYLSNPKDPHVWYGIGLLYELFGSEEHAEEAYLSVLSTEESSEETRKSYYRLGIIYAKKSDTLSLSEDCFRYLLSSPPQEVSIVDILLQLAYVLEKSGNLSHAKEIANFLLPKNPKDAAVHRLVGWLTCRELHIIESNSRNVDLLASLEEIAISSFLTAIQLEPQSAHSWYLLGRLYSSRSSHHKAYEAYQQAIYRDGRHPAYWCSIGILYCLIGQYKDSLDGYIRAIHLNSKISTVWFNLGILYEHCANQLTDAIDAYSRALELDPTNKVIRKRLVDLNTRIVEKSTSSTVTTPQPVELYPMTHYSLHALSSPSPSPSPSPSSINDSAPGQQMASLLPIQQTLRLRNYIGQQPGSNYRSSTSGSIAPTPKNSIVMDHPPDLTTPSTSDGKSGSASGNFIDVLAAFATSTQPMAVP